MELEKLMNEMPERQEGGIDDILANATTRSEEFNAKKKAEEEAAAKKKSASDTSGGTGGESGPDINITRIIPTNTVMDSTKQCTHKMQDDELGM